MFHNRKPLERRTYSEDRYYALIKRQKSGKATFKELTELDEIVNRVPDIREKVIMENFMADDAGDTGTPSNEQQGSPYSSPQIHHTLWDKLREIFSRVFAASASFAKIGA